MAYDLDAPGGLRKIMFKKKSYLEQLREYCENVGITLELTLDYGTWYIECDERRIGFSENTEDAAKMALEALKNIKKQESSTPHEDALRAWCKEMGYMFSDVNSCISIPELSLWRVYCYYSFSGDTEYACKYVLSKAKSVHDKAKQELKDAFKGHPEIFWTIPISHETYNSIGISGGPTKTISPCNSYPQACQKLIEAGKELLRDREPETPHESALRDYFKGREHTLEINKIRLEAWNVQVNGKSKGDWWHLEKGCKEILENLKQEDECKATQELETFCKENGLTLSRSGITNSLWRVTNSSGDWTEGPEAKDLLSQLKILKKLGHWIWSADPCENLKEFCEKERLRYTRVSINNPAIIISREDNPTLNDNLWFHGKTHEDAMRIALDALKQQKADNITFWLKGPYEKALRAYCLDMKYKLCDEKSSVFDLKGIRNIFVAQHPDLEQCYGYKTTKEEACEMLLRQLRISKGGGPYERKVRELCKEKGWALTNIPDPGYDFIREEYPDMWLMKIEDLKHLPGMISDTKGEVGFKQLWDNIQKLKELLS